MECMYRRTGMKMRGERIINAEKLFHFSQRDWAKMLSHKGHALPYLVVEHLSSGNATQKFAQDCELLAGIVILSLY